jgi:aryl-alcohol dehydrogenase-like predicted oxidoreductase
MQAKRGLFMELRKFKPFGEISALTLGGGGLGQVWGETSRQEALATVAMALDHGINHLDVAPMYGNGEAESVIGEALQGKSKDGLFVTTKCQVGTPGDPSNKTVQSAYDKLNASLTSSLTTLGMEKVDLFLMHSQLIEDDYQLFKHNKLRAKNGTTLSCYFNEVIPAFERLKKEGKIDNWGIGGIGQEEALLAALNYSSPPAAVQCVVNPLNSAGGIAYVSETFNPNMILNECQKNDIPILAIRAVQAGALTSAMDREPHPSGFDAEDFVDFDRAAPFRKIALEWGESPAILAHRYALSIAKVGSVILGVKNKAELEECLQAEKMGVLGAEQIKTLDNLFSSQ